MKNIHLIPTSKPSRLSILNSGKLNFGAEIMSSSNSKPQHIYITNEEISGFENNIWVIKGDRIFLWQNTMALVSNNKPKKIILTTDPSLAPDVYKIDDEFLEWFCKNPSCEWVEVKYELGCCLNCKWNHNMCPNAEECLKNKYKIIIPKKEPKPMKLDKYFEVVNNTSDEVKQKVSDMLDKLDLENKQKTLEEAAERISKTNSVYETAQDDFYHGFIDGAKSDAAKDYWFEKFKQQDKNKYSEEDLREAFKSGRMVENYKGEWEETYSDEMTSCKYVDFNKWFEQFKKK